MAIFISALSSPVYGADLFHLKEDWNHREVPAQPATQYEFIGSDELKITADKSVSFFYCELNHSNRKKPNLQWRWRVEKTFPPADLSRKETDDRPLAIHVWFHGANSSSVFGIFSGLFGYPDIAYTITYVFGGAHPPGTIIKNPYHNNGTIVILRGPEATLNHWYIENRNIYEDFRKSFPSATKIHAPHYIAVSADTDGTGKRSSARIFGLRLSANSGKRNFH